MKYGVITGTHIWVNQVFLEKLLEGLMLSLTSNMITVSSKTKNDLKKIKKSEKSVIIPNGIDFNHITEIKPSNKESTIIFAGRLIKEKNVDVLIQSIVKVKEKIPESMSVL